MNRGRFTVRRCAIEGIEAVEAASRHSFPKHTHDQYGIGVVRRGAQRSASGRGMVEAGAGDVITVNPGEVHDGSPIGEQGRRWTMLYIDPAVVDDALDDIGEGRAGRREFSSPVIRDAVLARTFAALFAGLTDDDDGTAALRGEERLLMLLSDVLVADRKPATRAPSVIRRAQERIDADPAAPVSLADLSRETGLSRYQVLRGFARATGLTPHAYLLGKRVAFARRMIAAGIGLAEASAGAGFADQSHMTRMFARTYGLSPRVYVDGLGARPQFVQDADRPVRFPVPDRHCPGESP